MSVIRCNFNPELIEPTPNMSSETENSEFAKPEFRFELGGLFFFGCVLFLLC